MQTGYLLFLKISCSVVISQGQLSPKLILAEEKVSYGWTTWFAVVTREVSKIVNTAVGVLRTVDIMKMLGWYVFEDSPEEEPRQSIMYQYQCMCRADSRCAPSQWETALLCDGVSHWLGASIESTLICNRSFSITIISKRLPLTGKNNYFTTSLETPYHDDYPVTIPGYGPYGDPNASFVQPSATSNL